MYKPLTLIIFSAFAGFAHSVAASDLPKPPAWGGQLKERPEWWTNVANQYRVSEDTNFWARIYDAKEKIRNDVGHGLSVIAERRQLIKYATHILETTELRDDLAGELEGEIALTYDYLGDHRRSILAYSELFSKRPDPNYGPCLLGLAMNYECIGDRERAIEVYKFMEGEYETNKYLSEYSNIGKTGVACLTGAKIGCIPSKPVWWGQFQNDPDWLKNMQMTFPPVTCFRDGLDYIADTFAKEHDFEREIKAWEELSQSIPLSYQNKTTIYMEIAVKYSKIGHYHRSIIYAWRVLDEYSSDVQMCKSALTWMSFDFEKLGDTNEVTEVKSALDCYSNLSK